MSASARPRAAIPRPYPAARCPRSPRRPSRTVGFGAGHPVDHPDGVLVALERVADQAQDPLGLLGPARRQLVGDVAVVAVELAGVGQGRRQRQGGLQVDLCQFIREDGAGVAGEGGVGHLSASAWFARRRLAPRVPEVEPPLGD
ncbi:MAG: hypothetical protein WKF75_03530 [Singulisphaera sp.]